MIVSVPEAAAVYAELESRSVLGDFRPGAGIRLGPHFFSTDDELRFASTMPTVCERRAERRLAPAATH